MEYLVGYTGFVGSNLMESHGFDGRFNSGNVIDAYGKSPELLVYAGVRAEMFLANKNPQKDLEQIHIAMGNIQKINPKKLVLISTIAVYDQPNGVDEDTTINGRNLSAYGKNRLFLEKMAKETYQDVLIVRLPGLYGKNIKKNFIYDYIKRIPMMLSKEKYESLSIQSEMIRNSYQKQENGFYQCQKLSVESEKCMRQELERVGFSSLDFSDSRGMYQYYNLQNLWKHIEIALKYDIPLLNLAVEPIKLEELYWHLTGLKFINLLDKPIPYFNVKTKYAELFGGKDGYIYTKREVISDIQKFIENFTV